MNRPKIAIATTTPAAIKTGNATRRRAQKWDKPVSRKFYFYLKDQASIASIYCKQIDETKVMTALEEYINGYAYVHPLNEMEKVVIKLLLPLIEKARERSRRARESAARRRQTRETEMQAAQTSSMRESRAEQPNISLNTPADASNTVTHANDANHTDSDNSTTAAQQPLSQTQPKDTSMTQRREASTQRRRLKHLKRIARRQRAYSDIPINEQRPHR